MPKTKEVQVPRLSIWNSGRRGFDYRFIDNSISEFFGIGGTTVLAHIYLGPYLQTTSLNNADGSIAPAYNPATPLIVSGDILDIQDPVLGEIRDRHYSPVSIELRGIYNINDLDFDLRQFGLFLTNDTLYIEFHLNDMIARVGRKLIPGDILELPHRRDTGLDPNNQHAANKFYQIDDASRAADGYSATWFPHIWRVKVSPMPASQEFQDILNLPATDPLGLPIGGLPIPGVPTTPTPTVGSIISTIGIDLELNEATDTQAKTDVTRRYFETQHFYMVTPEASGKGDYPWVFAGDGTPPNGAVLLGSGNLFPPAPSVNDYYLRTDYKPNTLFMWTGNAWQVQEQNYRPNWSMAHAKLLDFIHNDTITTNEDGSTAPEKTNLSRVVRPKADF